MAILSRRFAYTLVVIVFGSIIGGVFIDFDHPIAAWLNGENPFDYGKLCTITYNSVHARFLHIPFLVFACVLLISSIALLARWMYYGHN